MKKLANTILSKRFLLTLLLFNSLVTSNLYSQTIVWSEGFEGLTTSCGSASGSNLVTTTCTPANWLTSKNYPWIASSTAFRTGTRCIKMTNNWTGWLITAGANLNANTTYNLTFYYKGVCSSSCSAGMTVKVGVTTIQTTAPTTTTTVVNNGTQTSYTQFTYSYTPTVSGTYYFGLQMSSTIAGFDNGYIDDMQLSYNCSAPTVPVFTSGATSACVGGTYTYAATSTGTVSYSILSGGATINPTSGVVSSVTSNYVVRATATTGCGTQTTDRSVTVNANPIAPIISNVGSLTFCEGQNVQLTSNYSTGNLWSSNQNTESIYATSSGNYSVVYTDQNGCSATSNVVTVQVHPLPNAQITAQGATSFCTGGSVILNSSTSTGNLWSTSETTNSVTVNQSSDISLVLTDANGCSASSNVITVTVLASPSIPIINVQGSTSICEGSAVTLSSSEATGNVWSTNETTNSIVVSQAGNYILTVTNANGCSSTSEAVSITLNSNPSPIVSASGATTFCQGGNVQLSSSESTGNIWSNNNQLASINVTSSGDYSVTVTDINGCVGTSNIITVVVNPLPAVPTISANGQLTFCQGSNVVLTASSVGGNSWSNQATTNSITINAAGSYTVTNTNSNGCSATSSPTVVTVNSNPIASASLTSENVVTGSPAGMNYQWINCGTNQQIAGANSINYTAPTNGSYAVIVTNNSGCKDTSSCVTVSKVGIEEIDYLSNVYLFPNPAGNEVNVQFQASSAISQYEAKLYDTQGKLVKNQRMMNGDLINLSEIQPGMYVLEIQTEYGNSILRLIKE